jgi:hypothetical protein
MNISLSEFENYSEQKISLMLGSYKVSNPSNNDKVDDIRCFSVT